MLARVKVLAASLLLIVPISLAATGCSDKVSVGEGDERWATTENTNVKIDWDKVNEAYKLADGPADLERRINEIYEGDEIISIAVRDTDDRTQVVTGFFDRDGNGQVSDPDIAGAMVAPPAAPTAEAPAAAAVDVATGTATAPPTAAMPATDAVTTAAGAPTITAAPAAAVAPVVAAAPPVPAATGAEKEAIFTITRTVGADGSAQVKTSGYGPYYGYHSPMLSIMTGMMMGSMMSNMFAPRYMPMGGYSTSAARGSELRSQRSGYRAANPARFSKPSKTGRAYGGTKSGGSRPSAPARSRGGGRFGLHGTAALRVGHLAA